MQSLKRSLRFRWLSSQMEANLEASDLTAIELPPTYLRAFHSLIALDSSSTFLFERRAATSADPEKRNCNTANLALRQNKHKLFTGVGYQIRFKCGLKQDALYTSSS